MMMSLKGKMLVFERRAAGFLKFYSGWKSLLMLFIIILVVNFGLFPLFMPQREGMTPLDLMAFYNAGEAYTMISSYGEEGRAVYMTGLILIDFIYPVLYSLFLGLILFMLYARVLISISPLLILAADYIENSLILIMLLRYPERADLLAMSTGIVTGVKWLLVALIILLIIAGLIRRAIKAKS